MITTFQDIQDKINETFSIRLGQSFYKAYHQLFYEIIEWDTLGAKHEEVQKALQIFSKRRDKKIKDRSLGDGFLSRLPDSAFMQRMIAHFIETRSPEETKQRFLAFESALGRALPLAFDHYRKDELVLMQDPKDIGFYQAFSGHPHDPIPPNLYLETWSFDQFSKIIPLNDKNPHKHIKISERKHTPEEAVHLFWARHSSLQHATVKELVFKEGHDHTLHRLFGSYSLAEAAEAIQYNPRFSFGFVLLNTLLSHQTETEQSKKYRALANFFIQHRASKTPNQVEINNYLLIATESTVEALSHHLKTPFPLTQEAAGLVSDKIIKTEVGEHSSPSISSLVNQITSNPFLYSSFAENSRFIFETYLRLTKDEHFKCPQIKKDIENLNSPISLASLSKVISKLMDKPEITLPLISKWTLALQDPEKYTHQKWDKNFTVQIGAQINKEQFTADLIQQFCNTLTVEDRFHFLAHALLECHIKDPKTEKYQTLLQNIPVDTAEFEIFSEKIKTFSTGYYTISKTVKDHVVQDIEHQFLKNTYGPKNKSAARKVL
jgi:hypothetical protein